MRIKLKSDFRDFYDYAFHIHGNKTFDRIANDRSMSKSDQFEIFNKLTLKTPLIGTPQQLLDQGLGLIDLVVVYLDDRAHCGEGKHFTELEDVLVNHPNTLCSQWINTTGLFDESISYRLLQIGYRAWLLRYMGMGGWMSNHCYDTNIYVESEIEPIINPILEKYPLFAIDFVNPVNAITPEYTEDLYDCYAIDFNSAPGMRHTGMDEIITATEVYDLILAKMTIDLSL